MKNVLYLGPDVGLHRKRRVLGAQGCDRQKHFGSGVAFAGLAFEWLGHGSQAKAQDYGAPYQLPPGRLCARRKSAIAAIETAVTSVQ